MPDAQLTIVKRTSRGTFAPGGPGGPGRPAEVNRRIDRLSLAGAIRQMLETEEDEETKRPKLLELIHAAYKRAKEGDNDAMKLLFERGYGKTPPVYQLDPRILLEQLQMKHGLTDEDVANDPIASWFFGLLTEGGDSQTGVIETVRADQSSETSIEPEQVLVSC